MNLSERALSGLYAQQTILAALVITHPDPQRFATVLEQLFAQSVLEWAIHGQALPGARQLARELYEEIRDIARLEAERRDTPS